ncbi:MAG: hypothetical protein SVY15_09985 [Halobacteriota archaeon]|nr:hypothetical protein [Halobacteriota archaeon]
MQVKDKESELISFVKHLYKTATRYMTAYSSRFSRHDYTQPQLFVIGCIKKRLRLKYREVVEITEEMPKLKEILGLDTVRAEAQIPTRNKKAFTGKYRQLMLAGLDYAKYRRRSIVETDISVEKRVFGDCNTSRSDRLRNKECKLRDVCYNVYRYCKLLCWN